MGDTKGKLGNERIQGNRGRPDKSYKEMIMIKPRIIVTGATGKTSNVVVAELLKAGGTRGWTGRLVVERKERDKTWKA